MCSICECCIAWRQIESFHRHGTDCDHPDIFPRRILACFEPSVNTRPQAFALLRIVRIFPVDLLIVILILIVIVLQRRTPYFFADGFGYPHPSPLPVGEGTNRSFSLWGENPAPHQSISSNTQIPPSSWGYNFFRTPSNPQHYSISA